MNTFGKLFRLSIFGESHGSLIGVTLDGVPSGLSITRDDFMGDILRRKAGAKGTTTRKESDEPEIVSGIHNDMTTGAPLTIIFHNSNTLSNDYNNLKHHPRPSHSDFVAHTKYKGYNDLRGGGHFSGRLTLAIVGAGVIAKKILSSYGITISSELLEIGGCPLSERDNVINTTQRAQNSVGGLIECRATGLPIGLGEPFFDSVESVLSHLIFSIPAVKGVEFGSGFSSVKMLGSEHNDDIIDARGTTSTNHAGGVVGGISNGNDIVLRVAIKPTSSISTTQQTYNFEHNQVEPLVIKGRHDTCVALRAPVVVESMVAIGLYDLYCQASLS